MPQPALQLRDALVAALPIDAKSFKSLLADSHLAEVKAWPDGSLWIDLRHVPNAKPLTSDERWSLTGTHPGLPFTVQVAGERQPRLGVVYFDKDGTLPTRIEVNSLIQAYPFTFPPSAYQVVVESPGADPSHPAHALPSDA
jgi:hypothetical protein